MELFTAIKDALIARFQMLPWMDEETRAKVQDKVRPGEGDSVGTCSRCELSVGSRDQRAWRSVLKAKGASINTNMPHAHPGGTTRGRDGAVSRRDSF